MLIIRVIRACLVLFILLLDYLGLLGLISSTIRVNTDADALSAKLRKCGNELCFATILLFIMISTTQLIFFTS